MSHDGYPVLKELAVVHGEARDIRPDTVSSDLERARNDKGTPRKLESDRGREVFTKEYVSSVLAFMEGWLKTAVPGGDNELKKFVSEMENRVSSDPEKYRFDCHVEYSVSQAIKIR